MKKYNIAELAYEFIDNFSDIHRDFIETIKQGECFADLFKDGNSAIDMEINDFIEVNEYEFTEDERTALFDEIYKYEF